MLMFAHLISHIIFRRFCKVSNRDHKGIRRDIFSISTVEFSAVTVAKCAGKVLHRSVLLMHRPGGNFSRNYTTPYSPYWEVFLHRVRVRWHLGSGVFCCIGMKSVFKTLQTYIRSKRLYFAFILSTVSQSKLFLVPPAPGSMRHAHLASRGCFCFDTVGMLSLIAGVASMIKNTNCDYSNCSQQGPEKQADPTPPYSCAGIWSIHLPPRRANWCA